MSTPRSLRRALTAALAVVLGLAVLPLAAQPAAADLPDQLVFDGRGWGHGRGMSQWGSQGYATQHGWTSAQILDHYYGGTTGGHWRDASNRPVNPDSVRIRLRGSEGRDMRATVSTGGLAVTGIGSLTLPAGTKAIHVTRQGSGFDVYTATATTCASSDFVKLGNTGSTTPVDIRPTATYTGQASEILRLCTNYGGNGPGGRDIWYPGTLRTHVAGTLAGQTAVQQTVNITTIEQQLRSVVPRESPASWAAAALQSQSVAARSYALAGDNRYPGADTCDTIFCQVYAGHFWIVNGAVAPTTAASTDAALRATEGIVRLTSTRAIARTEFSSTSGGWTAGGTFTAVQDAGDVISPRHTWRCTVPTSLIESRWGTGGSLTGLRITQRNGLGQWGGRVRQAQLSFSNGTTATVTGDQMRSALNQGTCTDARGTTFSSGLLSDWFDVACIAEARYVDEVHRLFLGRSATSAEVDRWCPPVRSGDRLSLTKALSVSDEWAGVQIDGLYRKILGRAADAEGRAYWLQQVARGLRIEDIAAQFYGSPEYFSSNGGTNRSYVEALYLDLLERPADAQGRDHWASALDARRITRQRVAAEFYASIESRTDRVDRLFRQILNRPPDREGREYWTRQLLTLGDVALAANLAASAEYYSNATR
jgi:SpoIID/LytB domain protein